MLATKYFTDRAAWRAWLAANFQSKTEIWLEYPKKASQLPRILYNDAVEEALCFGWIDSTVKSLNEQVTIQRFCPRRKKSSFSQANKERLRYLLNAGLLHASVVEQVKQVLQETFVIPTDLLAAIKADPVVWEHYQTLSPAYIRIRLAYIEAARKRPEAFQKRLHNFITKTKKNQLIKGFGGIDKYY